LAGRIVLIWADGAGITTIVQATTRGLPMARPYLEWDLRDMRRSITVNDRMQQHYHYECVEPVGRKFDPEFKPD
jgi:hypothetical protein